MPNADTLHGGGGRSASSRPWHAKRKDALDLLEVAAEQPSPGDCSSPLGTQPDGSGLGIFHARLFWTVTGEQLVKRRPGLEEGAGDGTKS